MYIRNHHMVDNSGWCIIYLTKKANSTTHAVRFLRHQKNFYH